jgi:long-chain acyl-CoA synthetase
MTLYGFLANAARRFPERPAVIEGETMLTYRELRRVTAALAGLLRAQGVKQGDTVAIHMPNSIICIAAIYAAAQLGARMLMLDTVLKTGELERPCKEAGARLLLRVAPLENEEAVGVAAIFEVPSVEVLLARPVEDDPEAESRPDPDVLLLSSGTTGLPKIACRAAAGATILFGGSVPYYETDRVLAVVPFSHGIGFSCLLGNAIFAGAAICLTRFSPRETATLVEREKLTVVLATPFMHRMLAETPYRKTPDFSTVRLALSSGSLLSPQVAARFHETFGVHLTAFYGSTESASIALAVPEERVARQGWIGRRFKNVSVEVVSPTGEVLPPGEEGQVSVRSTAMASCYLNAPENTAATFVEGRVLTGDIGCFDEAGHLFLIGRKKSMLDVAGNKVSPAEVEACLLEHPAVADVVVTGVPIPDGNHRIKAAIVQRGEVTPVELRAFCAGKLADFKVPQLIEFVAEIPRGALGKPLAVKG